MGGGADLGGGVPSWATGSKIGSVPSWVAGDELLLLFVLPLGELPPESASGGGGGGWEERREDGRAKARGRSHVCRASARCKAWGKGKGGRTWA
uniref:Uncharacterized protein n=1 Tax=Arundo donax TaxID=35708 RepID=A0A0A9A274_ARUDO